MIAAWSPPGVSSASAGSVSTSNSPRERAWRSPRPTLVGIDRRQEADLAEVHREDRHARCPRSGAARAGSCRRRPGPRRGRRRRSAARRAPAPRRASSPCLPTSSRSKRSDIARVDRRAAQRLQRVRGLPGPAVGDDGRELAASRRRAPAGSTAAAPRRSRRRPAHPARPGSASQTNDSRLPLGPGSPEDAKPSTERRSRRGSRAPRRRARATRSPASRTTPPLPIRSRPTSNCGLTMASASKRSAAQASTAGSTLVSEMNDTSATIRSGR